MVFLTCTVWDVIGALLIIGGIVRLVAPAWIKKKGIGLGKWLMEWIPKWSDNVVRLVGILFIDRRIAHVLLLRPSEKRYNMKHYL